MQAPTVHAQVRQMHAADGAQRQAAARREVIQAAVQFATAHADVVQWLMDNESNEFAQSLAGQLDRKGFLTQPQVAAVRAKLAPAAGGAAIDVGRIEKAFGTARDRGLKRLRMHLDAFVFKPAKEGGRNSGGIYVTEGERYLGKVMGGKFLRTRECSQEEEQRIIAVASDPAEAAKAYGQRTGNCAICGRELTAEESLARFIGPVCAEKWGL